MPGRSKSVLEIAVRKMEIAGGTAIPSKPLTTTSSADFRKLMKKHQGRPRTPAQIRKMLEPSESQSQQAVIRYFLGDLKGDRVPGIGLTQKYPDLIDLYAVPNQGARDPRNGARMKAEGMFKSIPDICLPAPKGPFHGLYLEFKKIREKLRPDQAQTVARLIARGYAAARVGSAEQGIRALLWYLELGPFYTRPNIDEWRQLLLEKLDARIQDPTR